MNLWKNAHLKRLPVRSSISHEQSGTMFREAWIYSTRGQHGHMLTFCSAFVDLTTKEQQLIAGNAQRKTFVFGYDENNTYCESCCRPHTPSQVRSSFSIYTCAPSEFLENSLLSCLPVAPASIFQNSIKLFLRLPSALFNG